MTKKTKFILIGLGLVLFVSLVGNAYLFLSKGKTKTEYIVNGINGTLANDLKQPICKDDDIDRLNRYAENSVDNLEDLKKLSSDIQKRENYEHDANCALIAYHSAIAEKNVEAANKYYNTLSELSAHGTNPSMKFNSLSGIKYVSEQLQEITQAKQSEERGKG